MNQHTFIVDTKTVVGSYPGSKVRLNVSKKIQIYPRIRLKSKVRVKERLEKKTPTPKIFQPTFQNSSEIKSQIKKRYENSSCSRIYEKTSK